MVRKKVAVVSVRPSVDMPVRSVSTTRNGRPVTGYRWGTSGKIYTGSGAKQKAAAQGRAAYASGYKGTSKR